MGKKNEIRNEYLKRINMVIDFIEKNLEKDLPLQYLSKKAHFSPFHFHRIFSAIVGETINTFVTRKRIEKIAAILLVGTDKSLNQLAYQYGFQSGSSFSRAFKKFYGLSPTEFKTKGKAVFSKIGIETVTTEKYICSIQNIKKWLEMNAQIEVKNLSEIKLIGIRHTGNFDKIGDTYQKLLKWAGPKGLLQNPDLKAVTIYHDNPKITDISKVRLSACITVGKETKTEGEVGPVFIQEGRYAVGHFEIGAESFPKAWDSMCVWVAEAGYKFRDGDYFELYHNDHRMHPEHKFVVDICIPVVK